MFPEIRIATLQDAYAIAKVHVESWQKAYRQIIPDNILNNLSVSARAKEWAEWMQAGAEVLVALNNNSIGGFISFGRPRMKEVDTQYAIEITAIYVSPDKWRQGYGKLLFESALNKFSNNQIQKILLWVLEKNLQGRLFYEHLGFQKTEYFKIDSNDGVKLKEILYQKII